MDGLIEVRTNLTKRSRGAGKRFGINRRRALRARAGCTQGASAEKAWAAEPNSPRALVDLQKFRLVARDGNFACPHAPLAAAAAGGIRLRVVIRRHGHQSHDADMTIPRRTEGAETGRVSVAACGIGGIERGAAPLAS
jgi:hypothetical protein